MLQEFVEEMKKSMEGQIRGIHTAFPGTIVSYDTAKGLATVAPTMKFKKPDGSKIDYPQISGVPIVIPQSYDQNATIAYPIKKGDGCLIVISEQALDYWMYGQETDTDLAFDMTNAICIPGLFVKANSVVKEATDNNAIIVDVKGTRTTTKEDKIEMLVKGTKMTLESGKIQMDATDVIINGNLTTNGIVNHN